MATSLLIRCCEADWVPIFFFTISPYEWTFPWPPFLNDMQDEFAKEPTEIPTLETLHVARVLEQLPHGYLTGGNTNRWRTRLW